MPTIQPAYRRACRSGLLRERVREARDRLTACTLCPRRCGVNRLGGERGVCGAGALANVSSAGPHFGEEAPLVGTHGSGTIFLGHCNLRCLFCQNFEISHLGEGQEIDAGALAGCMLALQRQGCHNINLVTPSHVVPQILAALEPAIDGGLSVPIVYNSSGYDGLDALRLLDGLVDIYMPDFKFWDPAVAHRLCGAADYPEVARQAIREMHRQVGDLEIDDAGLARRGLLVRHLVMPGGRAGTAHVMEFLASEVSVRTYVNVMSQYRPCGRAAEVPGVDVAVTAADYRRAVAEARAAGITRLDRPLGRWSST
ncbi:MAG: radical SAM protein [Desulfobacterales bacterium]|nr:radical SAM protein [Desulfobacterales bacterium]